MKIDGKSILITGASGGIGSAIASDLSDAGAQLFLQYNNHPIDESTYTSAKLLKADFFKKSDIKNMFNDIEKLDVLVNVVGVEIKSDNPLESAMWEEIFQINLLSAVEICNQSIERMNQGVIINITSIVGNPNVVFSGESGDSIAYCASKSALHKLTEGIAASYSPLIRAVSIAPGYVMTPMWNEFSEEDIEECKDDIPLRKFVSAKNIAETVKFIIENDSITGVSLTIDGGLGMRIIY